jgi:cytosine/adenosine deaminase-related metal-dependent hydrolase
MPICCSRETWHFLTEVPNGVLAGHRGLRQLPMGAADRLGTLEPGKLAELLVVDGEPDHTPREART